MTTISERLEKLSIQPVLDNYHPIGTDALHEIESRRGSPLPDAYRIFVAQYGCSFFPELTIRVRPSTAPSSHISDDGTYELAVFFGSNDDTYGILEVIDGLGERLPPRTIPIANDDFGNLFVIGPENDNAIYFWSASDDEIPDDYLEQNLPVPDDIYSKNLRLVADSFSDFVERFVPMIEDEVGEYRPFD